MTTDLLGTSKDGPWKPLPVEKLRIQIQKEAEIEKDRKRKEEEKREEDRLASMSGPRKALLYLRLMIGNALNKFIDEAITFSVKVIAGLIVGVVLVLIGGLIIVLMEEGINVPGKPKPGVMVTPKGPRPIFMFDNE